MADTPTPSTPPARLLHLVEADARPTDHDPQAHSRHGGDLSACALRAFLEGCAASGRTGRAAHACVVLGSPAAQRRARRLGLAPAARVPTPFATPHAAANPLRRVAAGVRPDAVVAWSDFAARVGRLAGFGGAPLLEVDPHRPGEGAVGPAPPPGVGQDGVHRQRDRVLLLADPTHTTPALLAWRSAALAAVCMGRPLTLAIPPRCRQVRRVWRLASSADAPLGLAADDAPLPDRLGRAGVALAVWSPEGHASEGLVRAALGAGLRVVADPARLPASLADQVEPAHRAAPAEIARALLAALLDEPPPAQPPADAAAWAAAVIDAIPAPRAHPAAADR